MKAVIDIGSNSVRLMLDKERHDLHIKETLTTRLGEGLSDSKRIKEPNMSLTVAAVRELYNQARAEGADTFYIFATEAVRCAENGKVFLEKAEAEIGQKIDLIDGKMEAEIGYIGATKGLKGRLGVIDAGGASTELVIGTDDAIEAWESVGIGAVRLRDEAGADIDRMRRIVYPLLDRAPDLSRAETVIAIGGTATALAAADLNLQAYAPILVHRHRVTRERLSELVTGFSAGEIPLRYPSVSPARAQIILQGAVLYECIMEKYKLTSFIASETDNCDGYLLYKTARE